jgi:hypothetical protein
VALDCCDGTAEPLLGYLAFKNILYVKVEAKVKQHHIIIREDVMDAEFVSTLYLIFYEHSS